MGGTRRDTLIDMPRSPIIDAVEYRRRELKWTQRDLADACHTTQSHISAILAGRTEPTLVVLERMCTAVGITLAPVYTGRTPQQHVR